MLLRVLVHLTPQSRYTTFQVLAVGCVLSVKVTFTLAKPVAFIKHVGLVETDATLLKLFEVIDVLQGLVNVVLEPAALLLLGVQLLLKLHLLGLETV